MCNSSFCRTLSFALILFLVASCGSDDSGDPAPAANLPEIITLEVSTRNVLSVEAGGTVTSDGGAEITQRGICWSTIENPSTTADKTDDGTGVGTFSSELSGLLPGTTYYARSYAVNEAGTGYGEQIMFTTRDEYTGVYKVLTGSVFRETVGGVAEPTLSGDYEVGLQMEFSKFGEDTIQFFPMYINAFVGSVEKTVAIVDRSITSPDGSHPVKIMSLTNETLQNLPGTESKFFPGTPGTADKVTPQKFVLSFEWRIGTGEFNYRKVTNLGVEYFLPMDPIVTE
jgi:hypothetical protein